MQKCCPSIFHVRPSSAFIVGAHTRTHAYLCVLLVIASAALILLPLTTVNAAGPDAPVVTAASAIVIDADSGTVLFERNSQDQRPIASLTKLFTTWSAVQLAAPGRMMTVQSGDLVGEASMGLVAGERLSFDDLLHGMLLASGNDAAAVVARELGGTAGAAAFVERMNADARALGLTATTLVNPHGLDAAGHTSTARDVATLALAIHQLRPDIEAVLGQMSWTGAGHSLMNTNTLLGNVPGVIAGKTGVTPAAGTCLLEIVERNGRTLIVVTLGSAAGSAVSDSMALIDDGFRRIGGDASMASSDPSSAALLTTSDGSAAITTQDVGSGINPDARGSQWLWAGVALVAVAVSLSGFCFGPRRNRGRDARSRRAVPMSRPVAPLSASPRMQTAPLQPSIGRHAGPSAATGGVSSMTGPMVTTSSFVTTADVIGFAMTSPRSTAATALASADASAAGFSPRAARVSEYVVPASTTLHGGSMVPLAPLPVGLLAGTPAAHTDARPARQRGRLRQAPTQVSASAAPRPANAVSSERRATFAGVSALPTGRVDQSQNHNQRVRGAVADWTRDLPALAMRTQASSGD